MRRSTVLAITASLAVSACGGGSSGDDQARLAEMMTQKESFGFVDDDCIRDKTKELSDEDARILIDNIDADDVADVGLSPEGELWVLSLLDCVGGDLDLGSSDPSPAEQVIEGAPEGLAGEQSSPVAAGSIADIGGGWRLQVLDVVDDGTAAVMEGWEYNDPPPEGSRYTLVKVAVGYYGPGSSTPPFFSAIGSANTELDSYCGTLPDELNLYDEMFPGGVAEGNVCWVTTAADSGGLLLYASGGLDGSDVFLDASAPPATSDVMPALRGVQPGTEYAEARLSPIALDTQTELGNGWQMTVTGPAGDITDAVLAEAEYNEPPPEGYRFVGFEVTLEFDGEGSANAFDVAISAVGDSNVALHEECGEIPDELDSYSDLFSGAVVTGALCFVVPVEDVGSVVAYATTNFDGYSFFALG